MHISRHIHRNKAARLRCINPVYWRIRTHQITHSPVGQRQRVCPGENPIETSSFVSADNPRSSTCPRRDNPRVARAFVISNQSARALIPRTRASLYCRVNVTDTAERPSRPPGRAADWESSCLFQRSNLASPVQSTEFTPRRPSIFASSQKHSQRQQPALLLQLTSPYYSGCFYLSYICLQYMHCRDYVDTFVARVTLTLTR